MLLAFMKHARHRDRRECRFAVWAEEELDENQVDPEISPAERDANAAAALTAPSRPSQSPPSVSRMSRRQALVGVCDEGRPPRHQRVNGGTSRPADPRHFLTGTAKVGYDTRSSVTFGCGTRTVLMSSMSVVTTPEASELTGLSTSKLREWTSRRALIPADVPPKNQGSPAKYAWQTILLLRVAVILRDRFHLELHAHRRFFAGLRQELQGTSFVTLWGKSLAIRDGGRWDLVAPIESGALEGDALLIRLDPHLQALSESFALPGPSIVSGQLDLFSARAVRGKATVEQDAGFAVVRSVRQTAQQRRSA